MVKRIGLFLITNILVLLTISITFSVLGIRPYLTERGLDFGALLAFCAVISFAGAFVSLALSRWMAKFALGVKVIDPTLASGYQLALVQTVHRLAQKVGMTVMPEVGVYDSEEVNAFATGPTKNRSLVAVSTGLLNRMDEGAVEGVLGHEIAHIANGDMVTMTLLQGIVNTFVMFFARIAAWGVSMALSGDRDRENSGPSPIIHFVLVIAFEIMFSLLGAIVVAWFSRRREFRADQGGATLAGREKMIHALQGLKTSLDIVDERAPALATFKISGKRRGIGALFATHPSLDTRIAALRH